MFGKLKSGTWEVSSEKDPRWNKTDKRLTRVITSCTHPA